MRKPEYILQIAADTIAQLRTVDVFRVLDNCYDEERKPMARYIVANRPELTGEVAEYWSGDTLLLETHTQDDDCVVDHNALCIICHASHDERCDLCGGAGFHDLNCERYLAAKPATLPTGTCNKCGKVLPDSAGCSHASCGGFFVASEDDRGRTRMGNTPSPAHVTGLKAQLAAAFPWLTTDEDDQISGADVIDQLQQFYDNLKDEAIGLSGRNERKDFQK